MRNFIITVTGQKGSGKTTLVKRWLPSFTRLIVVDRLLEYDDGQVIDDFDPALDYLVTNWYAPELRLTVGFRDARSYAGLFEFLTRCAEECQPSPPTVVCVEEVDFFATPHMIDENLKALCDYGRHWNLSLIAIVRQDTGTHRSILHSSDAVVCLRQHKFSADMREKFSGDELREIMRLEKLTPGITPEEGKHYKLFPEDQKLAELFAAGTSATDSYPAPTGQQSISTP